MAVDASRGVVESQLQSIKVQHSVMERAAQS